MSDALVLVSCGNRTPIGTRSGITAASARAGFSGISLSETFEDSNWEAIRMGYADYLKANLSVLGQLTQLAIPALIETLTPLTELETPVSEIPVIVALPSMRPGLPDGFPGRLMNKMNDSLSDLKIDFRFEPIENGNAGFATGLKKARESLDTCEFCVVGGIDTFIDADTINWLGSDLNRLQSSTNKNGFIPGHAAGFCLLTKEATAKKYGLDHTMTVLSEVIFPEENPFSSGKSPTGRGLTRSIAEVLENVQNSETIDQIYTNLNGEPYNARDLAYAILNIGARIGNFGEMIAPFDCWGDIGVAAGPILVSLAAESAKRGYAKGPINLITLTSLENERGCVLLELHLPDS